MTINILDIGVGNVKSVINSFKLSGHELNVVRDHMEWSPCKTVIIPGVGNFEYFMRRLAVTHLDSILVSQYANNEGPTFIGICVGAQCMFQASEEAPGVDGLGLFSGKVIRCRDSESRPICRIGWYELLRYPGNDPKIDVVDAEVKGPFYFCHSFYCSPTVDHRSTYIINDSTQHVGMVLSDRRLALQFHPERSGKQGIALLADFAGGGHAKKQ